MEATYPTKAEMEAMSIAQLHDVATKAAHSFGANAPGKFADRASALKRTQRYIDEAKAREGQAAAKAAVRAAPADDAPEATPAKAKPAKAAKQPKPAKAPAKAKAPKAEGEGGRDAEPLNLKPKATEWEAPQKNSRRAKVLAMLQRKDGATIAQIAAECECTDRQARRDVRRINSKFGYGLRQDDKGRVTAYK